MKLPKLDIFEKYDHINPMKHLPRPQPSDIIVDVFNHKESGVFVDVGAFDGVTCSNSCVLEQGYNWTGICIEPNPISFAELKKYRTCELLNIGVSSKDADMEFWSISGYPAQLSGFHNFFSEEHISRILSDITHNDGEIHKSFIKSRPLQMILDERNLSNIDYLSIDCECADFEVLKSIDFNKTQITVISTESQEHKGSDFDIINFLNNKNYKLYGRVCNDLIFIRL